MIAEWLIKVSHFKSHDMKWVNLHVSLIRLGTAQNVLLLVTFIKDTPIYKNFFVF